MNRIQYRALIGAVAGLIAAVVLATTIGSPWLGVVLGTLFGVVFVLAFPPRTQPVVDSVMTAAALCIPLWALIDLIALPLAAGGMPHWSAAAMRAQFPALSGWVLYGSALGLLTPWCAALAERVLGPEPLPAPPAAVTPYRIVILGGGFAGVATAEQVEHRFRDDRGVSITLVSETNALLFTPMLAEVAASSLEASHISSPLRTSLRRTRVLRGRVTGLDVDAKRVHIDGDQTDLEYDQVVVALGAVSNYLGLTNVQAEAFDFKSLTDAIGIRNHVIDCFERADRERDPAEQQRLVTMVVAGGGFAGAELAGGLNDFARGMLAYYPNIPRDAVRVVLVHGGERILNELSEPLAHYAQRQMTLRGVTFRLKTRVKDARPGVVVLSDGEVPNATLVWTAGTAPNPLLKSLPVPLDKRGAVVTDGKFSVAGRPGMWVLGDSAAMPNAATGKPCPPTAQFAIRQAACLAYNLHATRHGRPLRTFSFMPLGALCVVGHHTACAEIKGLRFSGLFAWLMWRGIYLSKLPTLERKVRVLVDWTIELFFPRDIVQTIDLASSATNARPLSMPSATAMPSAAAMPSATAMPSAAAMPTSATAAGT